MRKKYKKSLWGIRGTDKSTTPLKAGSPNAERILMKKVMVLSLLVAWLYAGDKYSDLLNDLRTSMMPPNMGVLKELWKSTFNYTPPILEEYINANGMPKEKKETYIFYFLSRSVPSASVKHNIAMSKKLPKGTKLYLVFRGFDSKSKQYLYDLIQWANKKEIGVIAKMHPLMFRDLHIEKVPVFVIAQCPADLFRYKKCDYEYREDGDMSLDTFLRDVGERDEKYAFYRNYFIR